MCAHSASAKKSILIVEDTFDIRDCLQMLLEMEGYDVQLASNGQEALDHLQKGHQPNLILLDLNMPIMDGREFLKRREKDRIAQSTPTLVFAASKESDYLPGVSDWLAKPVGVSELLEKVEHWCAPMEDKEEQNF